MNQNDYIRGHYSYIFFGIITINKFQNELMIKLADIYTLKNETKRVEFFLYGIYDLLKEKLGFRYTKINGKGYYLKENDGIYEISYFHHLGHDFQKYIEQEFDKLEISNEIDYHSFMDEYFKQRPIRNGNYAREYLGEDFQLSPKNLHLVMLKIDSKYRNNFNYEEMLSFLKNENFIESKDKAANFKKDTTLFYKKVAENKHLIFHVVFIDKKSSLVIFDFSKIKAKTEKDFLSRKTKLKETIKPDFNLSVHRQLYEKEKTYTKTPI
ncbi:hypothetical protein ACE01N_19130 [Saccharicrinis sp. FJH2]|uniref:hypothetical protein n=1 Tax=Saccharicrinis sp. FJH65 TaxID=3344659 RepID=UPI0035F283BA